MQLRTREAILSWANRPATPLGALWPRQEPLESSSFGFEVFENTHTFNNKALIECKTRPVESKTRTYHGRVGTERTAGRRGGVGQDWTPSEQSTQDLSIPKPGHTLGGTIRGGARRDGGAGRGRKELKVKHDQTSCYLRPPFPRTP